MFERTPGPWDWEYEDKACTRPIALSAPMRDVLTISEDADGAWACIGAGNAWLIAMAPDLDEELRRLYPLLRGVLAGGPIDRDAVAEALHRLDYLRLMVDGGHRRPGLEGDAT